MYRYIVLLLILCMLTACTMLEGPAVRLSTPENTAKAYVEEERDWRIPPTERLRSTKLQDPTPMSVPGGKVLTTAELKAILRQANAPILINVMQGRSIRTIPGSIWLNGAGVGGDFEDATQQKLGEKLAKITNQTKEVPLVFYCLNPECWLAYNAVLRSAQLGYTQLYWYRGGMHAWEASGGPLIPTEENEW